MRLRDIGELPPFTTTRGRADLTSLGEDVWWAVARGEIPSPIEDDQPPIRAGRRGVLRWATAPVLVAAGLSREALAEVTSEPASCESVSKDERPAGKPSAVHDRHHAPDLVDEQRTT